MGEKKWRDEISELTPNFYMTEPRVSLDEEKVYIMLVSGVSKKITFVNSRFS